MISFIKHHWSAYQLFTRFFKESWIFVVFWLVNGVVPIAICMISSRIPHYGVYYMIGIGYVTAFQLAYVQIGWVVSIAITYTLIQMKFYKPEKLEGQSQGDLMITAIVVTIIYGMILVPLFVGPSYIYSKFANDHSNTATSQLSAYEYIFSLSGYIFLSPLISLFTIYINTYKGEWKSIGLMLGSNLLMLGLSAILTLVPHTSTQVRAIGTGLGMSIGAVIASIGLGLYVHFGTELKYNQHKLKWKNIGFIIKKTLKQANSILFIQLFKAIALIALGFIISDTLQSVVPMGYQFGRVLWYNFIYLIPFFSYGIGDALMFFGLRKKIKINYHQMIVAFLTVISLTLIIEIIIAIGLRWTVLPLANFYLLNKQIDWATINLNKIDLSFMLQQIAEKKDINQSYMNQLLGIIEANPYGSIGLQDFLKYAIVELVSNQGLSVEGMRQTLLYPGSRTYIFISVYSVCYSVAGIFNNSGLVMKRRYSDRRETLKLIVIQAIAIAVIVACGIELQGGKVFPMFDAWSLPLFVIGLLAFVYYLFNFSKTCIEVEKEFKKNQSGYVTLNDDHLNSDHSTEVKVEVKKTDSEITNNSSDESCC